MSTTLPRSAPAPEAHQRTSICERFAAVAANHADHIAVNTGTVRWTYREFDQLSDHIAEEIVRRQNTLNRPVVLLMSHDAMLIAAIMGVIKAGGIYLVLPSEAAANRLRQIGIEPDSTLLLVDELHSGKVDAIGWNRANVLQLPIESLAGNAPALPRVSPDALARIIFTSGSTGPAKAFGHSHSVIVQESECYREFIQVRSTDRLSLLTPCHLAASGTALFGALLNGATLCPFDLRRFTIEQLGRWLSEQGITIFHSVPTVFRHLVRISRPGNAFASVRILRLGGEALLSTDVESFTKFFAKDCRLMNVLSSAETGPICACLLPTNTAVHNGRVPVGRPFPCAEVFITDEHGTSLPANATGRIAVRSPFVREAYPASVQRQRDHAAEVSSTGRLYITNDLGRIAEDGTLEHLGRADQIVKIHGNRLDLGEIERTFRSIPDVRGAIALVTKTDTPVAALHVFVESQSKDADQLRRTFSERHPGLLIPLQVHLVDEFPQLVGGKIDTHALLGAANALQHNEPSADPFSSHLIRIWEEALDITDVTPNDDFFGLGGDSLAAASVFAAIEKLFGVDLPVSSLIEAPTVRQLARIIQQNRTSKASFELLALNAHGDRPPLYYIPGAGGEAIEFRHITKFLDPEQPCFAFQPQGLDGREPYLRTVEAMADRYLKVLRDHAPHGPYYLCGCSFGGVVAFEMACRLTAAGEKVPFLAMFDTYGGNYPRPLPALSLRKRVRLWLSRVFPGIGDGVVTLQALRRGVMEWQTAAVIRLDLALGFRRLPRPYRQRYLYLREAAYFARRRYQAKAFDGRILLFRAATTIGEEFEIDPLLGWEGMANEGFELEDLPCAHGGILLEPAAEILAGKLTRKLAALNKMAPGFPAEKIETGKSTALIPS